MKEFADGTKEYLNSLESSGTVTDGIISGTEGLADIAGDDTFSVQLGNDLHGDFNFKSLGRFENGKLVDAGPLAAQNPLGDYLRLVPAGDYIRFLIERVTSSE